MKQISFLICAALLLCLCGCTPAEQAQIVCSTLPVYTFTTHLCQDTGLTVSRLITESVSCLHDYTLQTSQMKALESAELVVINGAGLEDFLEDALSSIHLLADASTGLSLAESHHEHEDHSHVHSEDPHIWLSPENAKAMSRNIHSELVAVYPQYKAQFDTNLVTLLDDLDRLQAYGEAKLSSLSCRDLITFHDGFSYLAESFELHILQAVEEESGSEASAAELIRLINLVNEHQLPAIFTEINGSVSAAQIISAETGVRVYALDMAMAGEDYFASMYHNIDTLWEALQ